MSKPDIWVKMDQTITTISNDRQIRYGSGITALSRKGVELGKFNGLQQFVKWVCDEGIDDMHWVGGNGFLRYIERMGSNRNTIWAQTITLEEPVGIVSSADTKIISEFESEEEMNSSSRRRSIGLTLIFKGDGQLLGLTRSLAASIEIIKKNDGLGRDLYWIDDAGNCSRRLPISTL